MRRAVKSVEEASALLQRQARRECITVSFWGDLTLDLNRMFISRRQVASSVRHLRSFLRKRDSS